MLGRAVLAFLAMPGIVAFVIPGIVVRSHEGPVAFHAAGVPVLVVGFAALLWCVREFLVTGRGTLAPWDPPRLLVTTGPYRYSRNPMYVAVAAMLLGWAACFRLTSLWLYAAIMAVVFATRVVLFEEPWLSRTFGDEWDAYRHRVRRWV